MGSDKHQADDQVIPVEGKEESDKKNGEDNPATIPSPTKESIIKKVKLAYLREKIKDRIEDMSETVEHWGNTLHFIQACQNFSDKYKLVIGNSTDSNEQETGSGKDNQATEIESLKKKVVDLEAKKESSNTDKKTKKEIDMRLRIMRRKLRAKNASASNARVEAETVKDENQKEIDALKEGFETAKKDLQEMSDVFKVL
eukprot:TRINITY_DN20914_c0_g1_i16.p1 TRINITY_DN20914_c0_g1~~TRINITY_DN20914_c0_g1_i16.p1  ORF type:complete len:199 (+),score=51.14 TRINITY_DN20914_c0_g1_i16:74-670(+)